MASQPVIIKCDDVVVNEEGSNDVAAGIGKAECGNSSSILIDFDAPETPINDDTNTTNTTFRYDVLADIDFTSNNNNINNNNNNNIGNISMANCEALPNVEEANKLALSNPNRLERARKSDSHLHDVSNLLIPRVSRSHSTCFDSNALHDAVDFCLARQLINKALDNYEPPTNDIGDNSEEDVETRYLPSVDIMRGSMEMITSATEDIENRSFIMSEEERFLDENEPIIADVKLERLQDTRVKKKSAINFENLNLNKEEDLLKIADQIVQESMMKGNTMFQDGNDRVS
ncbi:unnamed protein product [Dimorphilus gyrociliatus]|uniref:Uncharacterized protein n=1 Tax=Dimorphilus gyrociliatus TaxID=2664684 RepID=A0A7I8VAA5_9ANNE|nr:unnamed protein product [Dimorphilus gyrociliatus]